MRKIREVLRLKHERGLTHREVAHACSISIGAVTLYVRRAAAHGWGWPLPDELDNATLEARLFPRAAAIRDRPPPAFAEIHRELARTGVTLQLLWEEYAQVYPEGYRYSQFCVLYRQWARRLRPSMRQVHRAGEKTFIDFSGKRPTVVDRRTGEGRSVELFVAVLGASSYTYAEATATQQLPDWVGAHTRMVEYFGGTTALWVPDQLKSAITRSCRYEAGVNRTYEELAAHYEAVVVPARPGIQVDRHLSSVPYQLIHDLVEVRFTTTTVEIYAKGRRITSHLRRYDGQPSTAPAHMPQSHRAHAEWTPSRLIRWAEQTGPATGRFVAELLRRRPHPEQGYRACLGIMRLGRRSGADRLEAASVRAAALGSYAYRTITNILTSAQDQLPLEAPDEPSTTPTHANIRGATYYTPSKEDPC